MTTRRLTKAVNKPHQTPPLGRWRKLFKLTQTEGSTRCPLGPAHLPVLHALGTDQIDIHRHRFGINRVKALFRTAV